MRDDLPQEAPAIRAGMRSLVSFVGSGALLSIWWAWGPVDIGAVGALLATGVVWAFWHAATFSVDQPPRSPRTAFVVAVTIGIGVGLLLGFTWELARESGCPHRTVPQDLWCGGENGPLGLYVHSAATGALLGLLTVATRTRSRGRSFS